MTVAASTAAIPGCGLTTVPAAGSRTLRRAACPPERCSGRRLVLIFAATASAVGLFAFLGQAFCNGDGLTVAEIELPTTSPAI